ncbi:acyl-CoA dehydrogenase [Mesorhizobium sp. ASY16-5R]|uniref:acyl-CoA dehydrogenase n=1 Tax=Mesorhizobium sp. ASY16-5R TaxID=3445772 RepID=UPI003FA0BDA0
MVGSGSSVSPSSPRDVEFNLFEVLDTQSLVRRERFAELDQDLFAAVLDTAHTIADAKFHSHYKLADENEPSFDGERVKTLPETKAAIDAFIEAGFLKAGASSEEGGLQLPFSVVQACFACFQAANVATTSYCFLTAAAANVIRLFGSQVQQRRFMDPMLDGRFLGTMCLSEPQAGSALSDIRTAARQRPDGSYSIRGTKMWISAGDHEMSENIVHLVLARIDGAPAGVKGISMFIVPKRRVDDAGAVGNRNGVRLMGLNHKMGWRGVTNTVLSFGDEDDCVGYLVGEANRGLEYMFVMMNEARISVGLGATMSGYAGYRYSLDYARNRPQGRLPDAKDPLSKPVMIVEHADVRRMLLAQKSYVEGALSLCLYAARLVDDQQTHPDDQARGDAELLLELLTPVVKAWPSEFCLEANKHAMQVLGGYGYTRDYPVEQFYRDNRLNAIHEGTNGIQALDLLGRKVRFRNGAALAVFEKTVKADIAKGAEDSATAEYARALETHLLAVVDATRKARAQADIDIAGYLANASAYCDLFGHLTVGWMWLRQAIVASARLAEGNLSSDDENFYQGKLAACRYFYAHEMGRIDNWLAIFSRMDRTTLDTRQAWL